MSSRGWEALAVLGSFQPAAEFPGKATGTAFQTDDKEHPAARGAAPALKTDVPTIHGCL